MKTETAKQIESAIWKLRELGNTISESTKNELIAVLDAARRDLENK